MPELASLEHKLAEFAAVAPSLADAHSFCEQLFQAFGWRDLAHAGAVLDGAPHDETHLSWGSTLLLVMRPRGARLDHHRQRAFEHWQYCTSHPRFVVLSNFVEFTVDEFDRQVQEPLDRLAVAASPRDHAALAFLSPDARPPVFRNDRVALTRQAVDLLAVVVSKLVARRVPREVAQRFILNHVFTLFTPSSPTLPFAAGELALTPDEQHDLARAAALDWSRVQLPVFGALFQRSLDPGLRHAQGAHFTSEADIQRIVLPTLVRPWRAQIAGATTREALLALRDRLGRLRVLDPACGSGNFLYVAYRELLRLELALLQRLRSEFALDLPSPRVSVGNFSGLDSDPFAVELAKVTMRLAPTVARAELESDLDLAAPAEADIREADALFTDWPAADVIVGNPPFQAKNNMQREFGPEYVRKLRDAYPAVSGMADYCVYWFRKAHDELPPGGRAGLVGTNTIRQNESRASGLGHIVGSGTIVEAVASEVWSGDAAVNVSVVNWIKQPDVPGNKTLSWQSGDQRHSRWHTVEVDHIGPSLSPEIDVSAAGPLRTNVHAARCYQGQTHGHEGFLLPPRAARPLLTPDNAGVLHPFLVGDDLLGRSDGAPARWVIDFGDRDLALARAFAAPFARVEKRVLPARRAAAAEEQRRNAELLRADPRARVNRHHANFLAQWWRLSWRRGEMLAAIAPLARFIACVRVTRRPIFEFVSTRIRPGDALVVFAFDDDYSFGLLQSSIHWQWFVARSSTLKRDHRYTSSTVFDAFPWPQHPGPAQVEQVARAAAELRRVRAAALRARGCSRRALYRTLDQPGPLRDAHAALDLSVRTAYGMPGAADPLRFLLALNHELAAREASGATIVGPGLAALAPSPALRAACLTTDCIEPPRVLSSSATSSCPCGPTRTTRRS